MGRLPRHWRQHRVTVEPYEGAGSYGEVYGPPGAADGFLDEQTRLVRSPAGDEVTSTSTFFCDLGTTAPAKSRVTLPDGRVTTVIAAQRRDGGRLPLPSHLEVQLE